MAITNTVSSNLSSAFIDCLDCFLLLPIRCDKVIEIVTSFLHKTFSDHVPPWDLKHENVTYKACARLQPPPSPFLGWGWVLG